VIPIFAVDKHGDPVYDLKEEEIELYINKKPYKILDFMSYQVMEEVEKRGDIEKADIKGEQMHPITGKTGEEQGIRKITVKAPERVIFIILDGISNSKSGVRNAQKLAAGLIKSAGPGDFFVLLQATPYTGLKYLIGPEKDKDKLTRALDSLYKNPDWVMLVPYRSTARTMARGIPGTELLSSLSRMSRAELNDSRLGYKKQMEQFRKTIREFKYALKTIRFPKVVFLVSGGIQALSGDLNSYDSTNLINYYNTIKQAAIDINKGGSLLYLVNPIPETLTIRKVLGMMSEVSNAKCVSGRDINEMVTQLKHNTAAYYEVAFSYTPELRENFKIKIKCKRKGVKLNTPKYGEKAKPYAVMPKPQKELYALNVITGGSWSRMVGEVKPTVYRKIEEITGKKKIIKKIQVAIPQEQRGKKLDVFILNVDPATLKANIIQDQKMTDEKRENLDLEVEVQKGKAQYIVIIEPETIHCVFTRIS